MYEKHRITIFAADLNDVMLWESFCPFKKNEAAIINQINSRFNGKADIIFKRTGEIAKTRNIDKIADFDFILKEKCDKIIESVRTIGLHNSFDMRIAYSSSDNPEKNKLMEQRYNQDVNKVSGLILTVDLCDYKLSQRGHIFLAKGIRSLFESTIFNAVKTNVPPNDEIENFCNINGTIFLENNFIK
ncbi:MAG: hypothetical protein MJK06_02565 [Hyphomicrobiales bacterium]|nr:hypothetical protein [Hyphomicrobiales bacterium]